MARSSCTTVGVGVKVGAVVAVGVGLGAVVDVGMGLGKVVDVGTGLGALVGVEVGSPPQAEMRATRNTRPIMPLMIFTDLLPSGPGVVPGLIQYYVQSSITDDGASVLLRVSSECTPFFHPFHPRETIHTNFTLFPVFLPI